MIDQKISEEKLICLMMEGLYNKLIFKKNVVDIKDKRELYPFGWSSDTNYLKKIKILEEAIEKECLISKTSMYIKDIEGIKEKKEEGR